MTTLLARKKSLCLEDLESRLNLSTLTDELPTSLATTRLSTPSYASTISKTQRISLGLTNSALAAAELQKPVVATDVLVGDTNVYSSSVNVPINDYTNIWGSKLEWRSSGQNIGWMSTSGSFVEYKLNVASAGNYTINLGAASLNNASADVYVNASRQASYSLASTGSWDSYRTSGKTVYLPAGTSTLRVASTNGTQYNLNAIQIVPQNAAPVTTTPSTTGTGSTTTIASSGTTSLPLMSYSTLSNSSVETVNGVPDLGYVSSSGAYVEYKINAPVSANYTLNVAFANPSSARANILVDGVLQNEFVLSSTGGWQNYATSSKSIYLDAGLNVLRIQSAGGTQYNIRSLSITSPGSSVTTPTPTPVTPAPAPAPTNSGNPVSVSSSWMTSFNQLNIVGSSGNDSIMVSQSGSTIYVTANGTSSSYSAGYGNIVIKGVSGNDTITVDSSVTVDALVFAGTNSSSTIKNFTRGHGTIVAIGNGYDNVTGNGNNTSYWVDSGDTVNASSSESSFGRVHRVSSFYGGVSTQLAGQNLTDPAGTGSVTRLTSSSLWGTGPKVADVNQGQNADCYLSAPIQSLAQTNPERLRELAVDLGDGTYAVQFTRNGVKSFVRIDGDLPAGGPYQQGIMYAHPGSSGNHWAAIMEKAYAIYRTGAWNYSSLNVGWISNTFADFGLSTAGFTVAGDATSVFNTMSSALSQGKAIAVASSTNPAWPVIGYHAYTVSSVQKDGSGNMTVTVRNPWGFDGNSFDGNSGDGYLTISMGTFQKAFTSGVMAI